MADDGPLIREDGRPSAKEMLRSARANEKLRATHAAELLREPQPEPEPEPPRAPSQLQELSDELLHEVLLHVEPAGLGRMERVAVHFWRPRHVLPGGDGAATASLLPRGTHVAIGGCQSAAGQALNGAAATVLGFDEAVGRYVLAVVGAERRKKLQRGNLTAMASAPEVAAAAAVSARDDRWRVTRRRGESWKQALHLLVSCLPPLRRLSCGSMHTVAADAHGRVRTWGLGRHGQLGHGRGLEEAGERRAEAIAHVGATDESLARNERERARWSGRTHASFLESEKELRPKLVTALDGERVVAVVAGGGTTIALTPEAGTGRQLWAWGKLADRASAFAQRYAASPSSSCLLGMPVELSMTTVVSMVSVRDSHAALITDTGMLYTWGDGSKGQLGNGRGLDYDAPHQVLFSESEKVTPPRIVSVACSSFATMMLTAAGQLLMCGQLPQSSVYGSTASIPTDGAALMESAATAKGSWSWGDIPCDTPTAAAARARAGETLTSIHDILAVDAAVSGGSSSNGCSSDEPVMVSVLTPMAVLALRGVTVGMIACGQDQYGAVTAASDGRRLFTWGRVHSRGAMIGEPRLIMVPAQSLAAVSGRAACHATALSGVRMLAMGMEHATALTIAEAEAAQKAPTKLWTWGRGMQGQLGHGDTASCGGIPRQIEALGELMSQHGEVVSVAAGNEHTALAFADGTLCTFGCGWFGRLGLGDEDACATPMVVEMGW